MTIINDNEAEQNEYFPSFKNGEEAYFEWAGRVLETYLKNDIERKEKLRLDHKFKEAYQCYRSFHCPITRRVMFGEELIDKMSEDESYFRNNKLNKSGKRI
ncbi:MAG: hypothetical protein QXI33_03155 [Candidatus Pacearchaeota archaeon]